MTVQKKRPLPARHVRHRLSATPLLTGVRRSLGMYTRSVLILPRCDSLTGTTAATPAAEDEGTGTGPEVMALPRSLVSRDTEEGWQATSTSTV